MSSTGVPQKAHDFTTVGVRRFTTAEQDRLERYFKRHRGLKRADFYKDAILEKLTYEEHIEQADGWR